MNGSSRTKRPLALFLAEGLLAFAVGASCTAQGPRRSDEAAASAPPGNPAGKLARVLNQPRPVTTGTGREYQPSPSPDGRQVAFVSDSSGNLDIWVLDLGAEPGQAPVQITDHTAGDMEPAWGPDAQRIAFTSRRSDPEGDLYVFTFPRLAALSLVLQKPMPILSKSLERLTDQTTSDRQPTWSPDGDWIAFTSRPHEDAGSEKENLWKVSVDSRHERAQLTRDGGHDPAWSPEGEYIAFAAERDGGAEATSHIRVLRLSDGREAFLTSGPSLDILPAWNERGDIVYLARFAEDTNGDGKITTDDHPSLWKVRFDPAAVFGGGAEGAVGNGAAPAPEPLTAGSSSDLFPAVRKGVLYFSSDRGGNLGIWALPPEGIVKDQPDAAAQKSAAEAIDRYETVDPRAKVLAYRKTVARFPAADTSLAARARYRGAEIESEMGSAAQADREFAALAADFAPPVEEAGLARLQRVRIAREKAVAELTAPVEKADRDARLKQGLTALEGVLGDYAGSARVRAYALIEKGAHLLALGDGPGAIQAYDEVERSYGAEVGEAAAEAAFRKGDVYEGLNDREGLLNATLAVLSNHAGSVRWTGKAAERAVSIILGEEEGLSPEEKSDRLRGIAEKYKDRPILAALALARLGEFLMDRGEPEKAEVALKRVVTEFPAAPNEVSRARFALAKIAYSQARYEDCLAEYRLIEKDHPEVERAYALARASYVRRALDKAKHEVDGRDPEAAAATLISLIQYDYDVPEAHRALIRTFVARRRTAEIVDHYRGEVKRRPGEAIPYLGLGFALTYLDQPRHFDEAADALRKSIAIQARLPHSHLTLGFLYEFQGEKQGAGDPKGRRLIDQALAEYQTALSLTDPAEEPSLASDLALNLGNANSLLGNYRKAEELYARRARSGFAFDAPEQQAMFELQYAETLRKLDRYAEAVPHYQKAREIFAKENRDERLYQVADSLGLCFQQMGRYGDAAASYRDALALSRKLGSSENSFMALRNLAMCLTFEGAPDGGGAIDPPKLEEALEGYTAGLQSLGDVGEKEASRGLLTRTVAVGGEGSQAAFGFGKEGQKKLIYAFMAKVYEEAGDHENAARILEKKLALIPEKAEGAEAAYALTDRAIILNQLGGLYHRLGRDEDAFRALARSLDLAIQTGSVDGMVKNAEALALIAIGDGADHVAAGEIDAAVGLTAKAVERATAKSELDAAPRVALLNAEAALVRAEALRAEPAAGAEGAKAGGKSGLEGKVDATLAGLGPSLAKLGKANDLLVQAFDLGTSMHGPSSARWRAQISANLMASGAAAGVGRESLEKVYRDGLEATEAAGLDDLRWRLLAAHGDLDEAARVLEGCLPGMYEGFGDEAREAVIALYSGIAARRIETGDAAGALTAAERAKGLILVHSLGLPSSDLAAKEQKDLVEKLAASIAKVGDATSKGAPTEERVRLADDARAALAKAIETSPALASLFVSEPANPAEVQALLESDAVVLRLYPAGARSIAFLVAPDAFEGKFLAIAAGAAPDAIAAALADAFGPRLRAAERIYLIADGWLREIDWPAVPWKREKAGSGPPEIARLLDLKHFLVAYERRGLLSSERLVFGAEPGVAAGGRKSDEPGQHTTVMTGSEATRAAFLKEAGAFHVIEIASPLRWESEKPWLSAFDLPGKERVNRLRIGDIAGLEGDFARLAIPAVRDGARDATAEDVSIRLLAAAGFPTVVLGGGAGAPAAATWGLLPMRPDEAELFAETNYEETLAAGVKAYKAGQFPEAARALEKALALNRVVDRQGERTKIFAAVTEALAKSGDFARAADYQGEAAEWTRSRGAKNDLAEALYYQGVFLSRAEKFPEAARALDESVALYKDLGDPARQAKAYATLGIVEEGGGKYEDALASFRAALAIHRDSGAVEGIAQQLRRVGRIQLVRLNNTVEAMEAFEKARAAAEQAGDEEDFVQATLEIGLCHEALGDFEKAQAAYQEGYDTAASLGNKLALSQAAIYMAEASWLTGDYGKAFEREREAVKLAEEIPDRTQVYMGENLLSVLYWTLNDFEKALEHAGRALAEATALSARQEVSTVHNNMGIIHREAGRYDDALAELEQALAIDREIRSKWGEGYDLRNIGMTYLKMKRLPDAVQNLAAALDLSRSIGDRTNAAKALLSLGDARREGADLAGAAAAYAEALADARKATLREVEWRALWGEGRIAKAKGDLEGARKSFEAAVGVVEEMRAAIGIEEFKNGFVENKTDLYEDLIELLLDRGSKEEAFAYTERSRARSFIDLLGNQRLRLESGVSQDLLDREKANESAIAIAEKALAEAGGPESKEGAALAERLKKLRTERGELLLEIKMKNPQLSSFVTVEPLGIQELWKLVDEGVVLLEYFLAKDEIVCFVIRKGSLEVVRTHTPRASIEDKIATFRNLIQGIEPLDAQSRELYDLLVRPVARFLRPNDVVGIVPHGILHYLSFAALNDGTHYLIEDHALFYTPSASVLKFTLKTPKPRQGLKILAIGNPDLGSVDFDLPFAEKEVSRIHWAFPDVTVLTRDKATEGWVTAHIGEYDVIHFAAHGEFDPVNPLASALKLAPDEKDDGDLSAREVFAIRANAELVTLSACQSGLGKIKKGDEVIGLSRAFLYAGTRSLVTSLWRVSDASTGMLIKIFYRDLVTQSKAESLRRAALHVKGYYPHPTYWAGFGLTGDYH